MYQSNGNLLLAHDFNRVQKKGCIIPKVIWTLCITEIPFIANRARKSRSKEEKFWRPASSVLQILFADILSHQPMCVSTEVGFVKLVIFESIEVNQTY